MTTLSATKPALLKNTDKRRFVAIASASGEEYSYGYVQLRKTTGVMAHLGYTTTATLYLLPRRGSGSWSHTVSFTNVVCKEGENAWEKCLLQYLAPYNNRLTEGPNLIQRVVWLEGQAGVEANREQVRQAQAQADEESPRYMLLAPVTFKDTQGHERTMVVVLDRYADHSSNQIRGYPPLPARPTHRRMPASTMRSICVACVSTVARAATTTRRTAVSTVTITRIELGNPTQADLFDNADLTSLAVVDVPASLAAFGALWQALVHAEYPEANIVWINRPAAILVHTAEHTDLAYALAADAEMHIREMVEALYSDGNSWIVDRDPANQQ